MKKIFNNLIIFLLTFLISLTFAKAATPITETIYWVLDCTSGSSNCELKISSKEIEGTYYAKGNLNGKNSGYNPGWLSYGDNITSIIVGGENDIVVPSSISGWFTRLYDIKKIDVTHLDISNVTSLHNVFGFTGNDSTSFEIIGLDNWDTSNVTDMSSLFSANAQSATTWSIGDLSKWNTSKVTDMADMFMSAGLHAKVWDVGDLSNWDTSNVTNMEHMFYNTGYYGNRWYVGDLSNWDTSKVTDMSNAFAATGPNASVWVAGDFENWDVSKVTDMTYMFGASGITELNMSKWVLNPNVQFIDVWKRTTFSDTPLLNEVSFSAENASKLKSVLHNPDTTKYSESDGKWYNKKGESYTISEIPNVTDTYYIAFKSLTYCLDDECEDSEKEAVNKYTNNKVILKQITKEYNPKISINFNYKGIENINKEQIFEHSNTGWTNGTDTYDCGEEFDFLTDTVLYPVWGENEIELPNIEDENFLGWSTTADGKDVFSKLLLKTTKK